VQKTIGILRAPYSIIGIQLSQFAGGNAVIVQA